MKLRSILAGALALVISSTTAVAQTNQGSSPLTGSKGGTNNAFMQFTGPATSIKTFALPNANETISVLGTAQTFTALKALTINQNASTFWNVTNNSAGTSALASYGLDNGTGSAAFGLGGTGYTGITAFQNRGYVFASTASDGIAIFTEGADPINFYANSTLAGSFSSAGVFSLVTPLALTSGGVGSGTAAGARTNLGSTTVGDAVFIAVNAAAARTAIGAVIGTDVQAFDADLAALAANSTDGLWAHTGSGTGAARTLTAPAAGFTITNPAGVAGNPTFVLANDLSALEGLSSTGIARRTGSDAWSVGTAVANSELAAMNAYTIKGNATGSSAVPTDVSIPALTQKASPVAADKIMIADSDASDALKYATVSSLASAGSVASLNGQTGAIVAYFPPQGRLTVTSGSPVVTATTTGNASIHYTPYVGDMVPIYDGTNIVPTVFAELSQALSDSTKSPAAGAAATIYDLFVWNDGGTIRCTRGPAWTDDTTRSAGTALVRVKGLLLNNASITNGPAASRGTYVGTIRTRAADATVDWSLGGSASGGVAGFLGVWNMYNRVVVSATVTDSGSSYTYATATVRQARADADNRISFVRGLQEDGVTATYGQRVDTVAASSAFGAFSLGFDTTSAFSVPAALIITPNSTVLPGAQTVSANWYPGIGLHFVAAVERGDGSNSNTFNNGGVTNGIGILTASVRM